MFPSKTIYVTHKQFSDSTARTAVVGGKKSRTQKGGVGDDDNIYINVVTDIDSNKIVYTNHVNCTIIALLKLGYEVIFLPSLVSTVYADLIMAEKFKNYDLEMIFANVHGYVIDSIQFVDNSPIYFKNGRVLMHMLHLIKPNTDFMQTFSRVFKSSHHFIYCIRVGLYNHNLAKRKVAKLPVGMTYLSIDSIAALSKTKKSRKTQKSKSSQDTKGSKTSQENKENEGSKNSKNSKDSKDSKSSQESASSTNSNDTNMMKRIIKRLSIAKRRGEYQKRKEKYDALQQK
jgi:hypothetical protein